MSSLGNNIALVAPSGIFNPKRLEQGIALLDEWGFSIQPSPNLHATHLCMAGTVQQRVDDILWACNEPSIDFIWFARGGYGTIQLLESIHTSINKPILGFSDATALGALITNQRKSWFYHAPVVHSLADLCNEETQHALRTFLQGGPLPSMTVTPLYNKTDTPITGRLVGGNLCVISSAMGTPYQLETKDCILMLEDVGEPAYKVHRMLTQLRYGGLLSQSSAIVLGTFSHCDGTKTFSLMEAIKDALHDLSVPVYSTLQFGHGTDNIIWNAGAQYTITEGVLHVE